MNHAILKKLGVSSAAAVIVSAMLFGSSVAWAQQKSIKEQLVGTWSLVSADSTEKDGKKTASFGAKPQGILIFQANGYYSSTLLSGDRPKFASGNRLKGTPEENAAAVHGSIAQFGTYSVDEKSKTLISKVEGSSFPNSAGETQKRIITTLTADRLVYTNPATTTGRVTDSVWRRVK